MAQSDLGNFIAELRKQAGMTQQDLADKLNITDKAVSKWERGLSSPDIDTIPRIAGIFGITSEELLNVKLKEVTTSDMKKWEYKCVCIMGAGVRTTRILNDYGRDGWELVCTCWIWHYFKRELN